MRFRIAIILIFSALCLSGCVSNPKYTIKSSSPAYIESDGVIICETTPCTITPPHYTELFGVCDRLSSMQSILTAFPIDKKDGVVQQKVIRARCDDNKTVYFDMMATGGIQTLPVKE